MAVKLKACCIVGNYIDHSDVSENKGYNATVLSSDRDSAQLVHDIDDDENNDVDGRISMKVEAWKLNCLNRV